MDYRNLYLELLCLVNMFIFGVSSCSDQQLDANGLCCNKCPPGYYVKDFCSELKQTDCQPCASGFFSDSYTVFDRCEKCRSCEQEYTQKCTTTTNAQCSCHPGFLCSNNICSKCEKEKYASGENLETAVVVNSPNHLAHVYEPVCPDHAFYDEKKNTCIARTLCSAFGLAELFTGNKTHNAICQTPEVQKMYVIVICGLVLLFVTIVVVFSYFSVKMKKTNTTAVELGTATECCQLSREETGPMTEQKIESFG